MQNMTGKAALDFNLIDSEGITHKLSDYHGHWLLMVFHRHLG